LVGVYLVWLLLLFRPIVWLLLFRPIVWLLFRPIVWLLVVQLLGTGSSRGQQQQDP